MAAKKKSAARRSTAAKARGKKAQKRPVAKKAARNPKPKQKRAVATNPVAARKATPAKAPSPALVEIDQRISLVQRNLRELIEQASASSGSATEELLSDRITAQEAELQRLRRERDALDQGGGTPAA